MVFSYQGGKMLKKILAIGTFLVSGAVSAEVKLADIVTDLQIHVTQAVSVQSGIDWKIGDRNEYTVDMGFLKGTMVMLVREIGADGIWIDQDIDLGFAGKQKASSLIDPNTGAVKKILVNGQEQTIPENNFKPVEVTEASVTVPAGTFDCIYIKLKDEKTGEEAQAWINPQIVSVGGSLKMIQPSQFGNVTIELKSFLKN
jgi:hypothetical protein